jgi:uncharacterized protein
MEKRVIILLIISISSILALSIWLVVKNKSPGSNLIQTQSIAAETNPLGIFFMRNQSYPGSDILVEKELPKKNNYHEYIASYISEGLKIYALLTVPDGKMPTGGWPAVIFNHGYIPPQEYRTDQRYIAYVNSFATNGYVVFKPDYRGNGLSEGTAGSTYFSPNYTIDVLNALSSIKRYPNINSQKIGMWGHSMGGNLTLRSLVISKDIKAAVIWGGVVGSYDDIINNWQNRVSYHPATQDLTLRNQNRKILLEKYGNPSSNPDFWNSIDPTYFISDISTPIQINVGLNDQEVPVDFSTSLKNKLIENGKTVEYYEYPGSDHNISQGFTLAMERSVAFFNRYLK